jgi:hypothetical protein
MCFVWGTNKIFIFDLGEIKSLKYKINEQGSVTVDSYR